MKKSTQLRADVAADVAVEKNGIEKRRKEEGKKRGRGNNYYHTRLLKKKKITAESRR